jgi:pyridoxine 5'-phosphate synthase PdxJ
VEVSVSALATTAYRVTAWVREDGRTVVAFQVGVGAALVTGQVDIEIAVLTECGAVGAIAADRLSGHLTWREAPGYGD